MRFSRVFAPGLVLLLSTAWISRTFAVEGSNSPYIDQLRKELNKKDATSHDSETPDPYIQAVKKRLGEAPKSYDLEGGYTEYLKKNDLKDKATSVDSYTDKQKSILGPPDGSSAIEAVKEGHSELHAKRVGEIHNAAGIRIGASINRDITGSADTQLRSFKDIYSSNYAPDLSLFYEYQPWHSEWYGNLGLYSNLGFGYYHGPGAFQFAIPAPNGGGNFSAQSQTVFQFFDVPITVGLNYRFNLFKYLRPFIAAGPTVIFYYEGRNDSQDGHHGYSKGVLIDGGISILMDWVSRGSSWDLYAEHGVKHYYLTIDYSRLSTFASDVNFSVSGIYAGLTFEF